MSRTRTEDQRLLTQDELLLVEQTRHPIVKTIADPELTSLVGALRQRRDRARDIASRQRREMRGKLEPSGTRPAGDDAGSRGKLGLLAAALKRVNKEHARRKGDAARSDLVANARRALASKKAADENAPERPSSRTAGEGMRSIPNAGMAVSGALEQEGQRPVLERSRKVR